MHLPTETLGTIAATQPSATRVFLRHRLDFCCGGARTLAEACAEAELDPGQIVAELDAEAAPSDDTPWAERPLAELADYIESYFHARLRRDVPGLYEAALRVERVHAAKPSVPAGLAAHLDAFWNELQVHMQKEETVLFPLIRQGVRGEALYMPVRVMHQEHDDAGESLRRIRQLTGNLVVPPEACATWTALYAGLEALEAELMEHIHLENNILMLRAVGASASES